MGSLDGNFHRSFRRARKARRSECEATAILIRERASRRAVRGADRERVRLLAAAVRYCGARGNARRGGSFRCEPSATWSAAARREGQLLGECPTERGARACACLEGRVVLVGAAAHRFDLGLAQPEPAHASSAVASVLPAACLHAACCPLHVVGCMRCWAGVPRHNRGRHGHACARRQVPAQLWKRRAQSRRRCGTGRVSGFTSSPRRRL